MSENRKEQEERKQNAPIDIPMEAKEKIPTGKKPEQQQNEEQLFVNYVNNLITTVILEQENAKQKSVDSLKNLGQKLGFYMKEVQRLTKENEELKKKK